jgi:hypothetical protein
VLLLLGLVCALLLALLLLLAGRWGAAVAFARKRSRAAASWAMPTRLLARDPPALTCTAQQQRQAHNPDAALAMNAARVVRG